MKKFIFCTILFFCIVSANAQFPVCEDWIGQPEYCDSLLGDGYQVFVVPNLVVNNQMFDQQWALQQTSQLLGGFLAPSPRLCGEFMLKYVCQLFGKCVESTQVPGVALWSRPCYSTCAAFLDVCYPVFDNAGAEVAEQLRTQIANCSAEDGIYGFPQYPQESTTYPIPTPTGVVFETVPCEDFSDKEVVYTPNCPEPWVFVPEFFEAGNLMPCAPPCPNLVYTKDEWDDAIVMITVVSVVGFVSTLLAGVTQAFFPKHRRYPGSAALYVTLCVNQISFAFMVVSLHGSRDVWCKNDYTNADEDDGFCVWQAFWLLFWALSGVFWWSTVAWNMFYILVIRAKPNDTQHYIAHALNWSLPLIITIVGLANNKLTYVDTAHWCFVNREDDSWWQYGLFYIPVGALILFALVMVGAVLWEMRDTQGRTKAYKYFRVFFFVFVWLYIYVFAFAYLGYNTEREDKFINGGMAYGGCLLYGQPEDVCEEVRERTPLGFWMIFAFNVCGEGMFIALLWGTTSETLSFWFERCRNLREGRSFFSGLTSGNTSTSSASATAHMGHSDSYDPDE